MKCDEIRLEQLRLETLRLKSHEYDGVDRLLVSVLQKVGSSLVCLHAQPLTDRCCRGDRDISSRVAFVLRSRHIGGAVAGFNCGGTVAPSNSIGQRVQDTRATLATRRRRVAVASAGGSCRFMFEFAKVLKLLFDAVLEAQLVSS